LDIIRKGNPRGLEDIYYAYYEKIKYSACLILKDIHASEDIASIVLKYILEKTDKIPYVENPDAWIIKISRNLAIDYIRKKSKTISLDSDFFDAIPVRDNNSNLRLSFEKCFLELTGLEQKILLFHYVYGYKYREISRILKRPIGTIKSDIRKIKSKLEHLKNFL